MGSALRHGSPLAFCLCVLAGLLPADPAMAGASSGLGSSITVENLPNARGGTMDGRFEDRFAQPEADRQAPVVAPVVAKPALTVLQAPSYGSISIMVANGHGAVTASRAADALGEPIDHARTMALASSLSRGRAAWGNAQMPSRMPLSGGMLSSRFGMRQHPILGGRRVHGGVDLAAPMGTPVVATSNGVVRMADWQGGYGLLVALEHAGGMQTRYGHMSRLNVVAGQQVKAGDIIGYVGSTGRSTGPHLHYEVRMNGWAVNPLGR